MQTNITVKPVQIDEETFYGVYRGSLLIPITTARPYTSRRSMAEREAAYLRQKKYRIRGSLDGYHCECKGGSDKQWYHYNQTNNQYAIFSTMSAAKRFFSEMQIIDVEIEIV